VASLTEVQPVALTFHFHKVSDWSWVTGHIGYFGQLSRTHLYIALVSVAIGLLLALLFGCLAARIRWTYPPILAVTTVLYAWPSLAAFALLLSLGTGLSDNTVIIPLSVYAFAVLVRSVTEGLNNVPDEVRIAATAMGYRSTRRLLTVELPAAVPVIVAGLRVATVSSISLVTVGSLIGIGGLGHLFTEGENTDFLTEIIAGVVIVAMWALIFDGVLLLSGRMLAPWARRAT
jgi:osmoprotectant transport system permease protein